MSRGFRRSLLFLVFLTIAAQVRLSQAQPIKPATPDRQPREIPDQELVIAALPQEAGVESPRAAVLNEGFEDIWPAGLWALGDFSDTDGGEYLWDDSNCWPHTGEWAGYSVGGGAQGNPLPCWGPYPNNLNTWATWGPFDLSSASAASLTFYLTGSTEGGTNCPFDRFFAGHSANGTNFNGTFFCGDWTTGTDGNQYNFRTIDLASRLGDASVWVAFALQTDVSNVDIGMMIDDVTIDVTSSCATPGAPALTAPANGASLSDTTPAFTWNGVANANEYDIVIDNNNDFSSPLINQTRTQTNFTPANALAAGMYFWRVGANNTAGGCSEFGPWSTVRTFTITSAPTCYQLTLDKSGQGSLPTAAPAASSGCANGRYLAGQAVNLSASPANGWRVGSWQGTNNNGSTANSNTLTMPAAAHTARVNYVQLPADQSRAALPFVIFGLTGFLGPLEVEPNSLIGEANGPILLNRTYQGYPNDLSDYYYLDLSTTRQLNITLTGITGTDPQLHLYRDSSANRVGYDPDAPYAISYSAPPGRYWVRVVVVGNYNTSSLYTLRVNTP